MIRAFSPADQEALSEIHERMGFDYRMPDLSNPLFLSKFVFDDEGPRVAGAIRLLGEAYLWIDPKWQAYPQEKAAAFRAIESVTLSHAAEQGLDEFMLSMPPELYGRRAFPRRLRQSGWTESRNWPRFNMLLTKDGQ